MGRNVRCPPRRVTVHSEVVRDVPQRGGRSPDSSGDDKREPSPSGESTRAHVVYTPDWLNGSQAATIAECASRISPSEYRACPSAEGNTGIARRWMMYKIRL
jgi:hypothetical protein